MDFSQIVHLQQLTWLSLQHGDAPLSDSSLACIGQLQQLTCLCLHECREVTDAGLLGIGRLLLLTCLDLSGCDKTTDVGVAHLAPLQLLEEVELPCGEDCAITDEARAAIHGRTAHARLVRELATQPTQFHASGSATTDETLLLISEQHQLTALDLSHCCKITLAGLEHVAETQQLTELDLRHCGQITDDMLKPVAQLQQLGVITLRCCTKLTDEGLVHLSGLHELTALDLWGTNIVGTGLQHLGKLPCLAKLCMRSCGNVTDEGLVHIHQLQHLHILMLIGCTQITDAGLEHVSQLQQLAELCLWHCCKITQAGIAHARQHLQRLTTLRHGMNLAVKTLEGKTISVKELLPSDSVGHVKLKIQGKTGVPVDQLHLVCPTHGGDRLEDGRTLSDCSIESKSTLHLGFDVFVKAAGRETVFLTIHPAECGASVKARLKDKTGVPPDQQRLLFAGKETDDNPFDSLSTCNVGKGATLFLWDARDLVLAVVAADGTEIHFTIKRTTPMRDLMGAHWKQRGEPPAGRTFRWCANSAADELEILPDDTADSLDLPRFRACIRVHDAGADN